LGVAKGRFYTPDELARKFSRALFPLTTNQYGCVTLHSYHFYVEEGLPKTQVLLWVYGEQLRALFDNVVLAESRCHYDWQTHCVFRSNVATDSGPNLPPIPVEACH